MCRDGERRVTGGGGDHPPAGGGLRYHPLCAISDRPLVNYYSGFPPLPLNCSPAGSAVVGSQRSEAFFAGEGGDLGETFETGGSRTKSVDKPVRAVDVIAEMRSSEKEIRGSERSYVRRTHQTSGKF